MGVKYHLKKHVGLRPFTCSMCNFRHWDSLQLRNTHFPNMHGRKGLMTDFVIDHEIEKTLEQQIQEEYQEIRANQVREYRKEPLSAKKVASRDMGSIYNDYKYEDGYVQRKF